MTQTPKRLMLDTNIYDLIVARKGFVDRVNAAVLAGSIEILRTHIQEDEIARIPDAAKRTAMKAVRSRMVSTSGAAWGVSKWDEASWGGGSRIPFGSVVRGNPAHSEDALIAMTADQAADVLVTEDKDLRTRAKSVTSPLEVWCFTQLVDFIDSL